MNQVTPRLFVAVKAVVVHEGKVLILRESGSYKDGTNEGRWDFPGGRLNPGENFEDALKREVKEEVGIEIEIIKPVYVGEWRPVVREEQWQIVGIFFKCKLVVLEIKLSEDHDTYRWINPNEFNNYDLVSPNKEVLQSLR